MIDYLPQLYGARIDTVKIEITCTDDEEFGRKPTVAMPKATREQWEKWLTQEFLTRITPRGTNSDR